MYDVNLMLLDATTVTADGGEQTGAYLDLWSVNADIGPTFDAYEDATPGTGRVVRPLVWTLIVGASALISDALTVSLEFSEDGADAGEQEIFFPTVVAADPLVARVQRMQVLHPYRYVRYVLAALGGTSTTVISLGPDDGGEYTSPGP
jgi:hypothetical protein